VAAAEAPERATLLPATEPPPHRVASDVLARGETLAESLRIHGVAAAVADEIARAMSPVFDFRYARPGDRYRLVLTSEGRVASFDYERSLSERYELAREGAGLVAIAHRPEIVRKRARVAGVVSTNLYEAIEQLGESRDLARDFASIFAWDVDFSRASQPGDEFSILYERLYARDAQGRERYAGPGQILAARYSPAVGVDVRAIYFEAGPGHGGYYRPDGSAVERQFLKAPLQYSRISSQYSRSRLHPILRVRRPHHGIDYAAPYGTPVWSVGGGEVVHKGWEPGFGNLVRVRHANGYVSAYGHLSRFAPGLRLGQRVEQKQTIGFVGSTGLSTGPHLCFRLAKQGEYVDPGLLRRPGAPAGEPLPRAARERFRLHSEALLADLDRGPLVVTNEAL
jgi:murein DD-endopeptidase MepM/ murein hydrolase activator NlpD